MVTPCRHLYEPEWPILAGSHYGACASDRFESAIAAVKDFLPKGEMAKEDERPPKVAPRVKSAPKIRQLFWCDFPADAQLPEFWKRRPVIVLSMNSTLYGSVVVVPCSTSADQDPKLAFPLRTTIDGRAGWAICDKPTTVAVSRLVPAHGVVARMPQDEFDEMLAVVLGLLPKVPPG
jgi:mRNA interferase MazF